VEIINAKNRNLQEPTHLTIGTVLEVKKAEEDELNYYLLSCIETGKAMLINIGSGNRFSQDVYVCTAGKGVRFSDIKSLHDDVCFRVVETQLYVKS
jgi:hypothetical protein